MANPVAVEIVLSEEERDALERWARRAKSAQSLALRCHIVLMCAEGLSNTEVAERLRVSRTTTAKWRHRFAEHRLDGLHDEPRPGAPRTVTDDDVERVVARTLEGTPVGATHWSTRSMATATGMSQSAVSRIWRAFGLKPHLAESFKLSPDPLFIEKVRDIVGLYLDPPDAAMVLCVDEKSQIQALDRTSPVLPLLPIPTAHSRAARKNRNPPAYYVGDGHERQNQCGLSRTARAKAGRAGPRAWRARRGRARRAYSPLRHLRGPAGGPSGRGQHVVPPGP